MFGSIGITKQFRETDLLTDKALISINDAMIICIGYDPSPVVNNLCPFRLRTENYARTLKEECLFLNATAIGHHNLGILFQNDNLKE